MKVSHLLLWIKRLSGLLGCFALIVMVMCTLLAIVARYFDVTGFEWAYEVAGIAFIWVTFLGTILAEARRENAAFTLLRDALHARAAALLAYGADAIIGLLGIALFASSIPMLQRMALVPTPLLRWPSAVSLAAAPVLGGALILIALLRAFLGRAA